MNNVRIPRPDDWHVHFRADALLPITLRYASRCFNRCVAMPNLAQPLINAQLIAAYGAQIQEQLPPNSKLHPLLTLYLTDTTSPAELEKAYRIKNFFAVKWYPAETTTHSTAGVAKISNCYKLLETMEKLDVPLLIHGESSASSADAFDRERIFLDKELPQVRNRFPELKITLEHISTKEAAIYLREASAKTAATLTPHHLKYNRNDMLDTHINPHLYCKPLLKREEDRLALCDLVLSRCSRLFLGSDSAPHLRSNKETDQGCAGIFSAPFLIEIYTAIFAELQALEYLADFASRNGALFYGFPIATETIELIQTDQKVPLLIEDLVPMAAGETLSWSLNIEK